jgi:hypothetical protein
MRQTWQNDLLLLLDPLNCGSMKKLNRCREPVLFLQRRKTAWEWGPAT